MERSTLLRFSQRRILQRWLERTLIACAIAALGWVAGTFVSAAFYRHSLHTTLENFESAAVPGREPIPPTSLAIGEPIGTLEIVRMGLTGVVVEGDDGTVLDAAIGHLPETPLPWNNGNSALAAHRDALFEPLAAIRVGDLVRLRTPHGTLDYRVRETLVVGPEDQWVLDPTPIPTLTLISRYPFRSVGPAPQRFIVRADRMLTAAMTLASVSSSQQAQRERYERR